MATIRSRSATSFGDSRANSEPRSRRAGRLLVASCWTAAVVLSSVGFQACAPGADLVTTPVTAAGSLVGGAQPGLRGGEFPTQRLYRVRYEGPDGQGSLKLTLRLEAPGRFQLSAADPLGRAVWTLGLGSGAARFLDHRRHLSCDLPAEVRLPQVVLAKLPVRMLPVVLLGLLPSPPAVPEAVAGDERRRLRYNDADGRQWSAVVVGEEVESWTLWEGDKPALWWSRQAGGGILSAHEGAQFRWRQTVSEPLTEALAPLEVPPGYESGECEGAGAEDGGAAGG